MQAYVDSRIHLIKDNYFTIIDIGEIDPYKVKIKIQGGTFEVNIDEKLLTFDTFIEYNYSDDSKDIHLLRYANQFTFYVDNLSEIALLNEQKYYIDKSFIRFFVNIIVSTIRGILLIKTRGTNLENIYLPIYEAENLIK